MKSFVGMKCCVLPIRLVDGLPVQVVEPPYELKLSCVDLRAMSDVEREQKIRQRIQKRQKRLLISLQGSFFVPNCFACEDDEHILILATHHMVSDAWSMGILTRELWSLYETYAAGKSSALRRASGSVRGFCGMATGLVERRSA